MHSQLASPIFPSMEPKQALPSTDLFSPVQIHQNPEFPSTLEVQTKSKRPKRNKRKRRDKRKKENSSSQGDSKPQSNLSSDHGGLNSSMVDEEESYSDQDTDTNSQSAPKHQKPSNPVQQQAEHHHSGDQKSNRPPSMQTQHHGRPSQPQSTVISRPKASPASNPSTGTSQTAHASKPGSSRKISDQLPVAQSVWTDPQLVVSQMLQLISHKVGTPVVELQKVLAEDSRFAPLVTPSALVQDQRQLQTYNVFGCLSSTVAEDQSDLNVTVDSNSVSTAPQQDIGTAHRPADKKQPDGNPSTTSVHLQSKNHENPEAFGDWHDKDLFGSASPRLEQKKPWTSTRDSHHRNDDYHRGRPGEKDYKPNRHQDRGYESRTGNDRHDRYPPRDDRREGGLGKRSNDQSGNQRSYPKRYQDHYDHYEHDDQTRRRPKDGYRNRSRDSDENDRDRHRYDRDYHNHSKYPKDLEYFGNNRVRDDRPDRNHATSRPKDKHQPNNQSSDPRSKIPDFEFSSKLESIDAKETHGVKLPNKDEPIPSTQKEGDFEFNWNVKYSDDEEVLPSASRIDTEKVNSGNHDKKPQEEPQKPNIESPIRRMTNLAAALEVRSEIKDEEERKMPDDLDNRNQRRYKQPRGTSPAKQDKPHSHQNVSNQQQPNRPKKQHTSQSKILPAPPLPELVDDGENYLAFLKPSRSKPHLMLSPVPKSASRLVELPESLVIDVHATNTSPEHVASPPLDAGQDGPEMQSAPKAGDTTPSPTQAESATLNAPRPSPTAETGLARVAPPKLSLFESILESVEPPTVPPPAAANTNTTLPTGTVPTAPALQPTANTAVTQQRQAPWVSAETATSRCADTRLHNELVEFGKHVAPAPHDAHVRFEVVQTFLGLLREEEARRLGDKVGGLLADVRVVGGWGLGCALNDEDVEVTLCVPTELTQAAAFAEPGKEEERYQKYQQFKKLVGQGNQSDYEKPLKELCNLVIKTINSNPHLFYISTLDDVNFSGGSGKNGPSQNAPSGKRSDNKGYHLQTNLILSRRIRINSLVHKGVTLLVHLNRLDLVMQTQEVAVQFALDFNLKYLYIALKVFAHQRFSDLASRNGLGFFQLFMLVFGAYNQVKADIVKEKNCPDIRDVKLSVFFMRMVDYLTTRFSPMSQMVSVDLRIRKTRTDIFCHKQEEGDYLDLFYPSLFGESNLGNQHMYHRFREFTLGLRNRYNYLRTLNHNKHPSILVHLVNPQYFDFDSVYLHRMRPEAAPLASQAQS